MFPGSKCLCQENYISHNTHADYNSFKAVMMQAIQFDSGFNRI